MAWTDRYVTDSGTDTYANSTSSATPMSLATALSNAVAGDRINIKKGTYTLAANFAPVNAGNVTHPIWWRGYNATPGDLTLALQSQKTLAIDTTNFPVIDGGPSFAVVPTTLNWLEALKVTGSINGRTLQCNVASITLILCYVANTGNTGNGGAVAAAAANTTIIACDLNQTNSGASSFAALYSTAQCNVIGTRMYGNSSANQAALTNSNSSAGSSFTRCVFIHTHSIGLLLNHTAGAVLIDSCTFHCPAGPCVRVGNVAATTVPIVTNCMMTDATYAFNNGNSATSDRPVCRFYNRSRDNTNADNGCADWPEYGRVTTDTGSASSDFIDLTGDTDYSLVAASPGRAAGYPACADMGALQKQEGTLAGAWVG